MAATASVGIELIFRTGGTVTNTQNGSAWFKQVQVERGSAASPGPRSYAYDALSRLTKVTAPAGLSIGFTYDASGNRTAMTDATGTTTYTYDDANRLLSKRTPDNKSITYAYNQIGKVQQITDYGGKVTSYAYDQVGRLESATYEGTNTAQYAYDLAGNRASLALPGGATTTYAYDQANRLISLANTNGSGQVLSSYGYTYDKANNITQMTDAKGVTTYSYDADNRLVKTVEPGHTVDYTYDAVGNRKSMVDSTGGTTTYSYDSANRLTTVTAPSGTSTYSWDANGNQLSDGRLQYSYDGLDRLVKVTGSGTTVTYQYDGDGLLTSRTAGSDTTRFYVNGQTVINEADGAGTIKASMFQGGEDGLQTRPTEGSLLNGFTFGETGSSFGTASQPGGITLGRKVEGSGTAYFLYNGHGDVTGLLDAAGTQIAANDYDAFGKLSSKTGSFDNPYLYAGEYYDFTTDLYYLRARFYSPGLGRFVTQDTYKGSPWEPWTQHLYAYVHNNPMSFVDPTGHKEAPGTGGGMGGGASGGGGGGGLIAFLWWLFNWGSSNGPDIVETGSDVAGCASSPSAPACAPLVKDAVALVLPGPQSVDLKARADEIQSTLPEPTQRRVTTGVARVQNSDGTVEIQVASSEPRLRPSQRAALQPGEVEVTGPGHAEQTILNSAQSKGQTVLEIAASRPICENCAQAIQSVGATPVSRLKGSQRIE